ncbi:T9SS type A sorting domain-containing protein [Altibacter lentus]|uniref:T9SS type A sorting domain-containing protein n=1 Tax=Altibacter lentus TaxID=1223410 RepID=UPI0005582AC9|nr:T9SS type A sorting domain-containing protein [Altibacter lentus]
MKKLLLLLLVFSTSWTFFSQAPTATIDQREHTNLGDNVTAYLQRQSANPRVFATIEFPDNIITTIATSETFLHSADFTENQTLYAVTSTYKLVTVEPTTGAITEIADMTGVPVNHNAIGLSYDFTTGTMYFISDDVNSGATTGQLFSVNLTTGDLTPIGTGLGTPQPVWLEIDNNGIAYMGDANTNSLYTVDLSTGVATEVGSFGGINLYNVRHGASFHHPTNTLYMVSVINETILRSYFFTINTDTGQATDLGVTPSSSQYGMFAIPGDPDLGVNDFDQKRVVAYPNPTSGNINIDLGATYPEVEVTISNMLGQIIASEKFVLAKTIQQEINAAAGVYFVKVSSAEEGLNTLRIIKQ